MIAFTGFVRLVLTAVTLVMDDEDVNFINSGTL
jgi:hypothetical protein